MKSESGPRIAASPKRERSFSRRAAAGARPTRSRSSASSPFTLPCSDARDSSTFATLAHLHLLAARRLAVDLESARLLAQLARGALRLLELLPRARDDAARLLFERGALRELLDRDAQRFLRLPSLLDRALALGLHP